MNHTTTRQRVGLALAGLLSLSSIPSVLTPTPDGEVGPPLAVLVLSTVVGVIGLAAVVIAWVRHSAAAMRIVAGCLIISVLTTLPAFFVDVTAWIKIAAGVSVLVTIAALMLMFSANRESAISSEVAS